MGVILMLLAVWLVYKPYLSDILFNNGTRPGWTGGEPNGLPVPTYQS
jgi:hypothetical protein